MKHILGPFGEWVGPPALKLQLSDRELWLDGRKRIEELKQRMLFETVSFPVYIARSHTEACKMLVHNGHQARAATHALTYAPELVDKSTAYLQAVFDASHHKLIPYLNALRKPEERHKLPRRTSQVVGRALRLKNRLEQEGGTASLQDLEEVLRGFIE